MSNSNIPEDLSYKPIIEMIHSMQRSESSEHNEIMKNLISISGLIDEQTASFKTMTDTYEQMITKINQSIDYKKQIEDLNNKMENFRNVFENDKHAKELENTKLITKLTTYGWLIKIAVGTSITAFIAAIMNYIFKLLTV